MLTCRQLLTHTITKFYWPDFLPPSVSLVLLLIGSGLHGTNPKCDNRWIHLRKLGFKVWGTPWISSLLSAVYDVHIPTQQQHQAVWDFIPFLCRRLTIVRLQSSLKWQQTLVKCLHMDGQKQTKNEWRQDRSNQNRNLEKNGQSPRSSMTQCD